MSKTLTVRVDLRAMPWPGLENRELGHGEVATLVRLLDLARHEGTKYHFFVSSDVMKVYPAAVESVLGDLHDLDWLGDGSKAGWEEAQGLARKFQHRFEGVALVGAGQVFEGEGFTTGVGEVDFPVNLARQDEFLEGKPSEWLRAVMEGLERFEEGVAVLVVSPQVLGRTDPSLTKVRQILGRARELGFVNRTFREILAEATPASPTS